MLRYERWDNLSSGTLTQSKRTDVLGTKLFPVKRSISLHRKRARKTQRLHIFPEDMGDAKIAILLTEQAKSLSLS